MGYTPQTKASIYDGERGLAKVSLSKSGKKAKVVMDESEKEYILDVAECPVGLITGRFNVSLSTDADKMFSFHPESGLFTGKLLKFSAPEDKPPTPKTNQKWQYLYFTVRLEIIDPQKFRGITVPFTLRYHFGEVEENDHSVVGYTNPNSKYTPVLQEFLEFTGAWEAGPIKWIDNILPVLETRMQKEARTFQFVIKNGWIETLIESDDASQGGNSAPWEEGDAIDDEFSSEEDEDFE